MDIAELGYQLADVAACLMSLTLEEYYKTHGREDGSIDDAYRVQYPRPDGAGEIDDLYAKFSLVQGFLVVDLGSFHLQ